MQENNGYFDVVYALVLKFGQFLGFLSNSLD